LRRSGRESSSIGKEMIGLNLRADHGFFIATDIGYRKKRGGVGDANEDQRNTRLQEP
jgi:hypothetical protein